MGLDEGQDSQKRTAASASRSTWQLAVLIHGKLGGWKTAASEMKNNTGLGTRSRRQAIVETRSFARFAHDSIWRHIVLANRAQGWAVRVVIHLWNPELSQVMDQMFRPVASSYEAPLPRLNKVSRRALNLRPHD